MDFAGVERLIDTPMKRYSSGLYARLGFAVAVFSRPDIVLVDEVLAVGDAAFRRRALESLRQLIAEGKTVLSSRTISGTSGGCAIGFCGWKKDASAPTGRRGTSLSAT